jgi:O-acetylserine/cysteine efflux transporter
VSLLALALCLLGALSWGVGTVLSRRSGVPGGLGLTVWSAVFVPVPLAALSLVLDGPAQIGSALVGFSWQAVASTLYTAGFASLVGYAVFNTLLSKYQSSAVVPWVLLAPAVAMVSAWLLLGQRPNAAETAGGVLLLLGVLIALRPGTAASDRIAQPERFDHGWRGQSVSVAHGARSEQLD